MAIPDFQIIAEAETASLLTMRDAVDTCRLVFRDLALGRSETSHPAAMFLRGGGDGATHFKVKGGYVPSLQVCGFRIAGDIGETGEEHYCYLLDPDTAEPRALVGQTHLHRMRTAATGLLGAELLTDRPDPVVALYGAGRIGSCLAHGFAEVFPGGQLRLASRRAETAETLADEVANPAVRACPGVEEAVDGADVVIALSASREPVLHGDMLRPGQTVIGMGEHHELPHELLLSADRFFVDDFEFATVLGSLAHWIKRDLLPREIAEARLSATIGELAAGTARGRTSGDQRILAIIQGVATADIALAEICRRRAGDLTTQAGETP